MLLRMMLRIGSLINQLISGALPVWQMTKVYVLQNTKCTHRLDTLQGGHDHLMHQARPPQAAASHAFAHAPEECPHSHLYHSWTTGSSIWDPIA